MCTETVRCTRKGPEVPARIPFVPRKQGVSCVQRQVGPTLLERGSGQRTLPGGMDPLTLVREATIAGRPVGTEDDLFVFGDLVCPKQTATNFRASNFKRYVEARIDVPFLSWCFGVCSSLP